MIEPNALDDVGGNRRPEPGQDQQNWLRVEERHQNWLRLDLDEQDYLRAEQEIHARQQR